MDTEELRRKWEADLIKAIESDAASLRGRRIGFLDYLESQLSQEREKLRKIVIILNIDPSVTQRLRSQILGLLDQSGGDKT